jgi:putative FmdB family regulatory protein
MPIYEYQCEKCGEFEVTQRITENPLKRCPTCKRKVRKLISNTSFQLKGSGWYITDYARGGKSDGETKEGGKTEAPAVEAKAESRTEAKTESKAEAKADKPARKKPAKAA